MTVRINIINDTPSIKIDPTGKIVMVDFKVIKGDKGDPGDPASNGIPEHLEMFDHGELHRHDNKTFLDLLTSDASAGLLVDGVPIGDFPDFIPNYQRKIFLNGVEHTTMLLSDTSKVVGIPPGVVPLGHKVITPHGAIEVSGTWDGDQTWGDWRNGGTLTVSSIFGLHVYLISSTAPPEPPAG